MSINSSERRENAPQSAYLTICGLAVTLTFDLLTSKFNQFVFVPNCTKDVNMVKCPPVICNISCFQTFST